MAINGPRCSLHLPPAGVIHINECDPMRFIANCTGVREQCEDTIGSYKCSCKQGFERRNGFCE
uniref:EGF-like calcium-binding domain-containing protein n=1 Tax=Romanomermis culicivorax TaxID=13658 RepID=A0A915KDW7_ROMCU